MISLSSIVVCIVACGLWAYIVRPAFISPLSKIPNAHFSAPFSSLWILWKRYTEQENRTIHQAHAKYGKIVRIGPNEVSVASVVDGIRVIYGGGFEKWPWYPNLFDNFSVPCMFSMQNSKPHSIRKRMISNIYSKSYIQSSIEFHRVSKSIIHERLLPVVNQLAVKDEPVDVLELNFAATMDFINGFVFGLGNGSDFLCDKDTGTKWLRSYQSRRPFQFWDGEMPYVKSLAKKMGLPIVPSWVNEATAFVEDWTMERCKTANTWTKSLSKGDEEHGKTSAIVYDQLTTAVNTATAQDPTLGPPEVQVASEILDHIAAGQETSSITLTYLQWELSRNPELQASLRKELMTLDPPVTLSVDGKVKELPSARAIDSLPLLHAVLMETLRIHPAIPGPQPRMTPNPPVSVAGSPPLEPGTRISAQAYTLHRNAEVYPEPEEWRPSRWLDAEEKKKGEMMKWFWAFGSGGRMCIGSNVAMQEMKLITAALYINFNTHVVDDTQIKQVDAYTAPPKGKVIIRFERVEG